MSAFMKRMPSSSVPTTAYQKGTRFELARAKTLSTAFSAPDFFHTARRFLQGISSVSVRAAAPPKMTTTFSFGQERI